MQTSMLPCVLVAASFLLQTTGARAATTHVVCAAAADDADCRYKGGGGIQAAVDAANNGDVVLLKAGRYSATAYRDVPFKIHTIRGFVVIDGKDLTLAGEPGAVLDGGLGAPTSAIVVNRANVMIKNLTITGFRFDVEEDEIYEGHGVFVIDSRVRIDDVTISKYQKMGLTGRGGSVLDVTRLRILDGHVAIWLEEFAYLRLRDALIRGNDSAGVAAYGRSAAHIANCAFDGNLDDALYSEDEATLFVSNTVLLRNKPHALNATGASRIWVGYSALYGNAATSAPTKGAASVLLGPNVIEGDPKLDEHYRLPPGAPLAGKGDPDLAAAGAPSRIGLR